MSRDDFIDKEGRVPWELPSPDGREIVGTSKLRKGHLHSSTSAPITTSAGDMGGGSDCKARRVKPKQSFISASDELASAINRGKSSSTEALDLASSNHGRFPGGDTSVDLAAINIALGLDVFGRGTPRLDAVHGGFPDIFLPFHRRRSSKDIEGGFPEHRLSFHCRRKSKDIEGASEAAEYAGGRPSSIPMQRQGSQQGLSNGQQPPSPSTTGPSNGVAPGMNGMAPGMLVHAGQQMDINYIHSKLAELSEQHRANREQTQQLIASTEQLAKRAVSSDATANVQEANAEIQAARAADARIAELTQQLAFSESLVKILKREQRENGKLIGEFEEALGKVTGMLRDFAASQAEEKFAIERRYLAQLQAERDEHQKTRIEKDEYGAKILDLQGKIRTAYRLRCEESIPDITIIAGLQNEVRAYRDALGMPRERFEDEFSYPVLKNVKNGAGEP